MKYPSRNRHPPLAESTGSKFSARNCRVEIQAGHVIPVADMSSICITTLRRRSQLIDRRRLCTRGWRARPPQTGKPTTAIIAAYHFRFERKLFEEEPRTSPRSTCERARRELGNPVNSLCTAIRVQSRSLRERSRAMWTNCGTNSEFNFRRYKS